jgi:hypothetical protein
MTRLGVLRRRLGQPVPLTRRQPGHDQKGPSAPGGRARTPAHLLALVLLKTYHRLGYFTDLPGVPVPAASDRTG